MLGMNKRKMILDGGYLLLENAPFQNTINPASLTHHKKMQLFLKK